MTPLAHALTPRRALLPACALLGTLTACSGGDDGPIGSGAGAGDDEVNQRIAEDIATLTPFAGIYDLTGNWRGDDGDIAYLIVREPSDQGISEVVLVDIDEVIDCRERPRSGELVVDDAGGDGAVFLNGLTDFDSAVAERSASNGITLTFTDTLDIDRDQNGSERISIGGVRAAISEQDLPADC